MREGIEGCHKITGGITTRQGLGKKKEQKKRKKKKEKQLLNRLIILKIIIKEMKMLMVRMSYRMT